MKFGKRFLSLALALVMVLGLTTGASAATSKQVTAHLNYDITVTYYGEPQTMRDAAGNTVYPISYEGTTYVPVRAVSNMLGIEVGWDQATQTVILKESSGSRADTRSTGSTTKTVSGQEKITASLSYGITVQYEGENQTLKDAVGNTVYPISYNGTTYLPVRAVSNMLGLAVDWDGATQTVILGDPEAISPATTIETNGKTIKIYPDDNPDEVREILKNENWPDSRIDEVIKNLETYGDIVRESNRSRIEWLEYLRRLNAGALARFNKLTTCGDAKILGEDHIGYDWAEIDWSNAEQGYVRVKINEQTTHQTNCAVRGYKADVGIDELHEQYTGYNAIPVGKWVTLPLTGSDAEYVVTIEQGWSNAELDALMKAQENAVTREDLEKVEAVFRPILQARFVGKALDEDALWLLSYIAVDFENSPLTCAKAQEITKNCKTDADKITAVFNWVANNIKYDYDLYKEDVASTIARNNMSAEEKRLEEKKVEHTTLDNTLTSKKGVCRHYAALMAGMLRSLVVHKVRN